MFVTRPPFEVASLATFDRIFRRLIVPDGSVDIHIEGLAISLPPTGGTVKGDATI